ncbi:MAG: hypothetical protein AAGH76_14970 [Pseudomonadota bacterium]
MRLVVWAFTCLALQSPAWCSALLPVSLHQSGSFGLETGSYDIKILLDTETRALASFLLVVDEHQIPITNEHFQKYQDLDLESLTVLLARDDWLSDERETLIPGFGVLDISVKAGFEACESGYAQVLIKIDTLDEYKWKMSDECVVETD